MPRNAALALLEAALADDVERLTRHKRAHAATANGLTPALEAIARGQGVLAAAAASGHQIIEHGVTILAQAGAFAAEINAVLGHVASVGAAVEQLAAATNEISRTAQAAAGRASESADKAAQGNIAVSSLAGDMAQLESAIRSMAENVEQFMRFAQEINKLTAIVKDIAQQTNLLALNAAIEAARAGEAGRGFAVVADEVKQLADKTAQATGEIESVTATMNTLSTNIATAVGNSLGRLGQSTDTLEQVAVVMADGKQVVADVNNRVHQIAAAAEQQKTVSAEMARNLADATTALRSEAAHIATIADSARALNAATVRQIGGFAALGHDAVLLQVAKSEHLAWKARLADVVHGEARPVATEDMDHTRCRLGCWIEGVGKARYADRAAFQALETPHLALHRLGREVAGLAATGKRAAARGKLAEMDGLNQQLFTALDQLVKTVRAPT